MLILKCSSSWLSEYYFHLYRVDYYVGKPSKKYYEGTIIFVKDSLFYRENNLEKYIILSHFNGNNKSSDQIIIPLKLKNTIRRPPIVKKSKIHQFFDRFILKIKKELR